MDEEIDVAGQIEGALVVLAEAVGAGSEGRRAVVGDVGQGRMAVADPEAHRVPTLVGHVQGRHAEAFGREGVAGKHTEPPVAAQL